MTNNTYYNTIEPLVQDLDENIIANTTVSRKKDSTCYITFHNPVTGSTDRVILQGSPCTNLIHNIFYVIGYSIDNPNEELEMEDLQDLYDFILIDDEDEDGQIMSK